MSARASPAHPGQPALAQRKFNITCHQKPEDVADGLHHVLGRILANPALLHHSVSVAEAMVCITDVQEVLIDSRTPRADAVSAMASLLARLYYGL